MTQPEDEFEFHAFTFYSICDIRWVCGELLMRIERANLRAIFTAGTSG